MNLKILIKLREGDDKKKRFTDRTSKPINLTENKKVILKKYKPLFFFLD